MKAASSIPLLSMPHASSVSVRVSSLLPHVFSPVLWSFVIALPRMAVVLSGRAGQHDDTVQPCPVYPTAGEATPPSVPAVSQSAARAAASESVANCTKGASVGSPSAAARISAWTKVMSVNPIRPRMARR